MSRSNAASLATDQTRHRSKIKQFQPVSRRSQADHRLGKVASVAALCLETNQIDHWTSPWTESLMRVDLMPSRKPPWRSSSIGKTSPSIEKRLEEPHTETEREILLKLLGEEEKKEAHPKKEA